MVRVRVGVRVHRKDDTWLGLRCRQQVGVTVSVLSLRQGRVRVKVRVMVTARGAQVTQKAVRMRTKPETKVIHARGLPICSVRCLRILLV